MTENSSTSFDVIVVGAGAAGLMCAMTAAKRGRRVLVIEKSNKAGKKILMSGGGRCNFTNYFVSDENFISQNPHFCKSALNRYTQWDFIGMVEQHGVAYEERKHGQLFCQHSAKDILDILLKECREAGVSIKTRCALTSLRNSGPEGTYRVTTEETVTAVTTPIEYHSESVVVATGALSIPTLGGSGQGYDIAKQFNLGLTARQAGLVPLMFSDALKPICERLSGIAVDIEVECNGQGFSESMLFTHRGISGPAILQISSYWTPGEEISVNLLPHRDAAQWLLDLKRTHGGSRLRSQLNSQLPKALVNELQALWWPEYEQTPLADISDNALHAIGDSLNRWQLKPSASEGYRTAEVTLGGVDTANLSSKTMEATRHKGLFFIGEVVDVTGHLGGFNFQWAWSSGYTAGMYA